MGIVVLRSTSDVVERVVVVDADFVKLGERKVGTEKPCLGIVVTSIDSTVAPHADEILIGGVKCNCVVVDVLVATFDSVPRLSLIHI